MEHFSALISRSLCMDSPLIRSSKGESVSNVFRTEKANLPITDKLAFRLNGEMNYSHLKVNTLVSTKGPPELSPVSTIVQFSTYPSSSNVYEYLNVCS